MSNYTASVIKVPGGFKVVLGDMEVNTVYQDFDRVETVLRGFFNE